MEAASYRAARDRWGGYGEQPQTPLQRYILNAVDPTNYEPNLALNLEIVDLINSKKGNAPREAAITIVSYVNHRNHNVSLLALSLLDICVKNCGYPFHLQISTKEFLNELVRRFPERPPAVMGRGMMKVLELIEEWRTTICRTSRYREDLGFIRDMHRLLSYKGYVFPQVKSEDAAVLNESDTLRSAEEMEEEEKAAQSAKLQELIRRGTPHDLQEANKLMKVMAGYDNRNKTDWRAKAAEEVVKVQQKARLLEDMLQKHQAGAKMDEGDVFEELATALQSAHPKIQKMCEEESDDHEAVAKLFEINDSIHRTIERYKLVKKGDLEAAAKIPAGTLGSSGAGVGMGTKGELSLIDLGGPEDEPAPAATASAQPLGSSQPQQKTGNALEDDLLGLSMDGGAYGTGGAVSLGGPANGLTPPPQSSGPHLSNSQITSMFNQSLQQAQRPTSPTPSTSAFAALSAFSPGTSSRPSSTVANAASTPKIDPFASLNAGPGLSAVSRGASPFHYQQSIHPPPAKQAQQPTTDLLGLMQSKPALPPAPALAINSNSSGNDDGEWNFTSALPPPPTPQTNTLTITPATSPIRIHWSINRSPTAAQIDIASSISSNSPLPISDLTFQVAVSKGYQLKMEPQSGRTLAPAGSGAGVASGTGGESSSSRSSIKQLVRVFVPPGEGRRVKMRWKVGFVVQGEGRGREEGGEVAELGID